MNNVERCAVGIVWIMLSVFSFFIPAEEVSSIGISGADLNAIVDFESGLKREFSYDIMVTNPDVTNYEAFATDELAKYIHVEPRYLKFDKTSGEVMSFKAYLNLPEDEKEIGPGKHCAGVGANEMADESVSGNSISTRTSAKGWVCVRVLYNGKYVEAKLHISNANEGETLHPEVSVSSWGKEDIKGVYATIMIYDANGSEIKSITTTSEPLPSQGNAVLRGILPTKDMKPGDYKAKAMVYYDGETAKAGERGFKIGTLNVIIIDHTKEIIKNKISRFEIKVESKWNNRIDEVYARIIIGNQDIRTLPAELEQWSSQILSGYVDSTEFEIGEIPVRIIVYYGDQKSVYDGVVNIIEDPNAGKLEWFKNLNVTIALVIVLVILIELIWIIGKKVNKDDKERKKT